MNLNGLLLEKLQEALGSNADAIRFFKTWCEYIHEIDDLIDETERPTPEAIIRSHVNAASLYSSNFWHRNGDRLYPIVLQIANEYADSVRWENTEDWRQHFADVLSSCGNNMLMMIVGITAGWDKLREISELIREESYAQHHNEIGDKV